MATVPVTGTATPNASVEVEVDDVLAQTVTANGSGNFSTSVTSGAGAHTIRARQLVSGSYSPYSSVINVTGVVPVRLVTVGYYSSGSIGRVAYSDNDGSSWTTVDVGYRQYSLLGYLPFCDTLVAFGSNAVIYSSDHGATWYAGTMPNISSAWTGLACSATAAVVCGHSSQTALMRSTDGINWTDVHTGTNSYLSGVAYGGGRFVVSGDNNHAAYVSTTDGASWAGPYSPSSWFVAGVAYDSVNSLFISNVMQSGGNHYPCASTAALGTSWSQKANYAVSGDPTTAVHGAGVTVLVLSDGNNATSTDGTTWTPRGGLPGGVQYGTFNQNRFVFGVQSGASSVYVSQTGTSWATRTPPTLSGNGWVAGVYI